MPAQQWQNGLPFFKCDTQAAKEFKLKTHMNAEFVRQALEKAGNPNVLVNLISRRVRRLNSGGGAASRPLAAHTENLGAADIALREEKMGWEMPDVPETPRKPGNKSNFMAGSKALRAAA